jgi:hypothetical protein
MYEDSRLIMSDRFDDDGSPSATEKFSENFVDPRFWKPKNLEIIDWKKWESLDPSVPQVFDPPQKEGYGSLLNIPLWWWNRSCYCQPCPILWCCGPKPEMERISDESEILIRKLLGPNPDSTYAPEVIRNKLVWTEENIAPETLISFNRWAWRSQTEEGRVIGLGSLKYDWTNDSTCFGLYFSYGQNSRYATVQESPDKKWILLGTFSNPDGEINYLWIYIVQEGDVFSTPDGTIIDNVKPGDGVRVSWDSKDPYDCDNKNLTYMYFPRVVAMLNQGQVVKNDEHYDRLLERATNDPEQCCSTCCYSCSFCMSSEDRFNFQTSNISDLQIFAKSPSMPRSEVIDRI